MLTCTHEYFSSFIYILVTNKCEAWDETQYNCSSSISVRPECYGHLKCRVRYEFEDRTDRVDDCLYINFIYLPGNISQPLKLSGQE